MERVTGDRESVSERRPDVLVALGYGLVSPVHIELGVEDGFPCLPDVPI